MSDKIVVRARISKDELRAALDQIYEDRACLLFFLIGAEREGVMFQGRRAGEALTSACRLLRISDTELARIKDAVP